MKARTFWLALDNNEYFNGAVFLYSRKPELFDGNYVGKSERAFCAEDFKKITGITIKTGECRKFRLEEIKK